MKTDDRRVPVLIAGGGPVGLLLASELGRFGVPALVVERRAAPEPESVSAVRGVSRRSLDTLELRGLKDPVIEASRATLAEIAGRGRARFAAAGTAVGGRSETFGDWRLQAAMKGHFGVIPLFDTAGEFPDMAILPVAYGLLERVLEAEATRQGGQVLRGRAVCDLAAGSNQVTAVLDDESVITADYVVGADGGRSTVRRTAGFAFPGTDPTMIARGGELVTLPDPEKLPAGITRTERGVLLIDLIPGQIQVLEYGRPSSAWARPTDPQNLQASLRRVSQTDVTVTGIEVPIRYTDNARQAARYRRDRILLAGDAAHVHSPFGAQGLNLGLQDAANLGWKLARVIAGHAPDTLLDTYGDERHPVAERVLRNSRAQAALIHPNPQVDALRGVFAEVIEFPDVKRHFIEMVNGVDVRYDFGGGHPLTGAFLPPPTDPDPHVPDGRYVLVNPTGSAPLRRQFGELAAHVRVVTAGCPGHPGLGAALVRPDGYVIWAAGKDEPLVVPESVRRRWFGEGERAVR